MLSTRLTRAGPRATTVILSSSSICTDGGPRTGQGLTVARPRHQRRPSSSKASTPPHNNASKPAPAAKTGGSKAAPAAAIGSASESKSNSKGRPRGSGLRRKNADSVDQFAGLPSVPSIQSLETKDIRVSAFFSLHRPISINTTIPPPATLETFGHLFHAGPRQDTWENGNSAEGRPEDVIYALHSTFETIDQDSRNAEDEGLRWEILHESPSNTDRVKHLDGPPRMKNLDEVVAQFKPFRAPPPPEPFASFSDEKAAHTQSPAKRGRKPKHKVFVTEIRVTESTHADGRKTYAAISSPVLRLDDEQNDAPAIENQPPPLPFLHRLRRRQRMLAHAQHERPPAHITPGNNTAMRRAPGLRRDKMSLLSIKRIRKLKMKKHKHKKLLRRTRSLRKRQGRL